MITDEGMIKKGKTAETSPENMEALKWSDLQTSEFTEFILSSSVARSSFYTPNSVMLIVPSVSWILATLLLASFLLSRSIPRVFQKPLFVQSA